MILINSGLPIVLNEENWTLTFGGGLVIEDSSSKSINKLTHVLAQPQYASEEIAFRFYKGIHFPQDEELLESNSLRYDITLLLPGLVGKERKKTTGHFHKLLPGLAYSHAELYEVIQGTALYILQPITDMTKTGEQDMIVDQIITVEVHAGEKIIVPANCTHCTVNAGSGALVFSNLVLADGQNEYGGIGAKGGMGVYVLEKNGDLEITQNPRYNLSNTKICKGAVIPNDVMGTLTGKPTYTDFIENPKKFGYLKNPSNYITQINAGISME